MKYLCYSQYISEDDMKKRNIKLALLAVIALALLSSCLSFFDFVDEATSSGYYTTNINTYGDYIALNKDSSVLIMGLDSDSYVNKNFEDDLGGELFNLGFTRIYCAEDYGIFDTDVNHWASLGDRLGADYIIVGYFQNQSIDSSTRGLSSSLFSISVVDATDYSRYRTYTIDISSNANGTPSSWRSSIDNFFDSYLSKAAIAELKKIIYGVF